MKKKTLLLVLVSALVFVGTANAGLVAHWSMEEGAGATTLDAVSASNDAIDGAVWDAGAFAGSGAAIDFSAATNPATYTAFSGIAGSADRTVTAWVKTDSTGRAPFMSWGDSGSAGGLGGRAAFVVNGGALRFEIGGGFAIGTAQIADGQWHHVAISTTGTDTANTVFWVDGVLDATAGFGNANPINSLADYCSIGGEASLYGGKVRFPGVMDELRVYDTVLTEAEVAASMVPEPATMMLMGLGGLLSLRRRK